MCTVVIDVEVAGSARLLAVRDEDPAREWDALGEWWPEEYPGVIGIRDRRAGGAWLAVNP
ncbi:NRDE family protein, partial [Microbacterium sp. NRRL B-14842]